VKEICDMPYQLFRLNLCVSKCKTEEPFLEDGVVGPIFDIVA